MDELYPNRGFTEPIKAALLMFVLGFTLGASLGVAIGDMWVTGFIWGACSAYVAGLITWFAWLVHRLTYHTPQAAPEPVEIVAPEPVLDPDLDIARYIVGREDGGAYIIDPGCTANQLLKFAQAICHDHATMTVQDIVVKRHIFLQDPYKLFRSWMVSQRYARPVGNKGETELTESGNDFVNSVFSCGVQFYSPARD